MIEAHLRRANAIARAALEAGHHPFGALLVAPDGQTVLPAQGNVGAVEHAEALLALAGNHPENPTLDRPCRELFARGQKAVEVIGPVPAVEPEIAALHQAFWKRAP